MQVVIIGGNAAGMSAASRLRRKVPEHQVIVFEKSGEVSYGACGLPYYISGENTDINRVRIRTAVAFRETGIDLRLYHIVQRVDPVRKTVTVLDCVQNTNVEQPYDKLLVASGSSPIMPAIPGHQLTGIFCLKTIDDAERIRSEIVDAAVKTVAIVGAGYIGMELAEACVHLGKELHIFEAKPQCLPGFDPEFGEAVEKELEEHGACVHTDESVTAFEGESRVTSLRTSKGNRCKVDLVVVCIGVRPNTAFLPADSVEMLRNGAIVTDSAMRSTDPDIFAAGDCATSWHALLDCPVFLPLATNANKQGRLAADSISGEAVQLKRALGTSMLRCLGLEFGKVGLTQTEAENAGIPAKTITIQARTHARYYPGASDITIKLCYNRENKVILGAQLMGNGETAWRTDVFACAIDQGMTTTALGTLDLAYCPVISTVWDPILIAGNAAK